MNESLSRPQPHCFRLTVTYDGTDYYGWQVQPGLPTLQGELAEAVRQITGEETLPQGSGRTDTGVHAEGQIVSLALQAAIPAERLHRALNRRLPAAIRVMTLEKAAADFHPRAAVLHKTYEYRIFERRRAGLTEERICPPREARFVWDCRWPLDLERMERAAAIFVGTHDFTSFAAHDPERAQRLSEGQNASNVRIVFASAWQPSNDLLIYRVTGNGFLHHMVRNIVGTCVEAGAGRMGPEGIHGILAARDRRLAGATAPPQGLHLMQVVYANDAMERVKSFLPEMANA